MTVSFFEQPILNYPYKHPGRRRELDDSGNATGSGGAAGLSGGNQSGSAAGGRGGNQPHPRRAQTVAAIEALTKRDFPPTTNHHTQVTIHRVDVFHPNTGEIRSDGPEGIACWSIDTNYNEESLFVRHAYSIGQNDPYTALNTTVKAEIDEEAWESLNSDTSRPFKKSESGRIAVMVINHLGDEVMKVFRVA